MNSGKTDSKQDTTQIRRAVASGDGRTPFVNLIPNLITVAAIACGMTAIRFAIIGNLRVAALLILLAAVLDTLDGFLARRLGADSDIGAELDSLADFLDFGAAPAVILHVWLLQQMPGLGWAAALAFVIAAALRLARFNVMTQDLTKSAMSGGHFIGVPAPGAALLALGPLFVSFAIPALPTPPAELVGATTVIVALLMVSRLPTWSFKALSVRRSLVPFIILGVAILGVLLVTHTWLALSAISIAYACVVATGVTRAVLSPNRD